MASGEKERPCTDDNDCSAKEYCYEVSRRCVDYTLCKRYNRQESETSSRHPSQCGPCLPGYIAEELNTGESALLCKMHNDPVADTYNNSLTTWIVPVATIGAIVTVVGLAIFIIRKKYFSLRHGNNISEWNEISKIDPSAPPLENGPIVEYGKQINASPSNNNRYLRDKNTLVTATPFKDPSWIRSNPNYAHRLSNESLNIEQPDSPVQLPIEDVPTQPLAIQSHSQFTDEHRDNAVNAGLIQRDHSLMPSTSDDNNDGPSPGPSNSRENQDRARPSNILISQRITMNLNVINGDC